jgi:hypothetical protein
LGYIGSPSCPIKSAACANFGSSPTVAMV